MNVVAIQDIGAAIGGAVGIFTLVKATIEYMKQGQQRRAEQFLKMSRFFFDNLKFCTIRDYLDSNSPKMATLPLADRRAFGAFLEEVALLTNSGLLTEAVSLYFFGYFAIDCWENEHFWFGLERDTPYWSVLRDYVGRCEHVAKMHEAVFRRSHFQF